jgi:hypothetical protein
MEAYGGNGGIAPLILKLGTGWKRVVSFKSLPRLLLSKRL